MLFDVLPLDFRSKNLAILLPGRFLFVQEGLPGLVSEAVRDKVHILGAKASRLKTVLHGVERECAGGLFAGEPFLGGGGEHALISR